MITSKELQNKYNTLYTCLRNYVWPMIVIESIADVEVDTYSSFPDLNILSSKLTKLENEVSRYLTDDEDLNSAFNEFHELLNSNDTLYAKLDVRTESED